MWWWTRDSHLYLCVQEEDPADAESEEEDEEEEGEQQDGEEGEEEDMGTREEGEMEEGEGEARALQLDASGQGSMGSTARRLKAGLPRQTRPR